MPLRPATIASQADTTSLPTGETMPRPVTTTRRLLKRRLLEGMLLQLQARQAKYTLKRCSASSRWALDLALMRIDVVDGLLNRGDLFGILIRDLRLEFLFECHHQFNRVQRVCAQIVDE